MKIIEMKVENLIPYVNNPRFNAEAVEHVAASIREFGFKVPILIDQQNIIVAGDTRLRAAHKLGLETVPVIKIEDLTPAQLKAFRIADNKVAEFASWDMEKLKIEFEELKEFEEELDSEFFTGFDEFEKHDLFKENDGNAEKTSEQDSEGKISYILIFRNHNEQQEWVEFLSGIKGDDPEKTQVDYLLEYIRG